MAGVLSDGGSGDGDGSGDGYIADYAVRVMRPWGVLAVGCEVHPASHWRAHWREIADAHDVEPTAEIEAALLAACAAAEEV